MFFKKKKKVEVVDEIDPNKKRFDELELEIEKIKSHIISLRGFVNRRMAGEIPSEETFKNTDGLDGLRFNKKSGTN